MLLIVPILWLVAEIFVAIKVSDAIGVLATMLALAASIPIGLWAMRSQSRGVMRRLAGAVAERRTPTREVIDGALVLIGGMLLIIPGFITDVLGLVLMVPPTRALTGKGILRKGRSYLIARVVRFDPTHFGTAPQAYDVESTAREVPPPKPST
ncbi:MAG: FxsA family protein [Solirubrobacteraceae bacterium]